METAFESNYTLKRFAKDLGIVASVAGGACFLMGVGIKLISKLG